MNTESLHLVSFILATVMIVVSFISMMNDSREMKAVKVYLAFVLVGVNIALATLGNTFSWGMVVLWTIVMVLNLLSLTYGDKQNENNKPARDTDQNNERES